MVHSVEAHSVLTSLQRVSLLAALAEVLDTLHIARREGRVAVDAQRRPLELLPALRHSLRAQRTQVEDELHFGGSGVVSVLQQFLKDGRVARVALQQPFDP